MRNARPPKQMGVTADAATRAFNSDDIARFYARPGG